ncbi:hypothetical protein CONPUDRAFT_84690 [Coniophora puteana RWD-64-598 SS2]|uniref:Uncharacterized protein n=1 Tax=Coniophora puteana (strain RWD-64-598) TaxID=741705 RepID=A0A5M3MCS9_CONPW|nr:uncharacterized protein CONPUDRAFT_84690 [Coniophora puteana RWD-64-598 SS2]EIW76797.1 hypothetical protein CONPUDRAFT_84690 [Coniophora puteana RWD-64-598 SS2]
MMDAATLDTARQSSHPSCMYLLLSLRILSRSAWRPTSCVGLPSPSKQPSATGSLRLLGYSPSFLNAAKPCRVWDTSRGGCRYDRSPGYC